MVIGILVSWIAIGLLVGFIGGKFVNMRGDDPRLGYGVAGAAAVVVGALYCILSGVGVETWSMKSMIFAAIGAALAIVVWHLVRSKFVSHDSYTTRRSY